MKAKELKAYLSLIDDEEEIKISIGSKTTDLASVIYNGKEITFCCHNYGCNDDEITLANMAKYLSEKK